MISDLPGGTDCRCGENAWTQRDGTGMRLAWGCEQVVDVTRAVVRHDENTAKPL